MKKKRLRIKNEKKGEEPDGKGPSAAPQPRPEPGAESQLHNYNVMLSRLGDLFGDEDEPAPPKKEE